MRRGAGAAILVALTWSLLIGGAAPAMAHTTLVGSSPSAGQRLAYPPDEIVLTFGSPVSPQTVQADLRSADGTVIPVTPLVQGDAPVSVIGFSVPRLPQDIYGLSWQSVGPDGHRVVGEVLFGVGVAVGEDARVPGDAAVLPALLDAAGLALRILTYVGLALLAGLAVLGGAGRVVSAWSRSRLPTISIGLAALCLLRAGIAWGLLKDAGAPTLDALTARGVAGMAAVGVGLGVSAGLARRGRLRSSRGRLLWSAAAGTLAFAVVGLTLAGHAVDREDPLLAITFGLLHLGAAALWTGPVLVLLGARSSSGWAALADDARRDEVQQALRRLAPVAGWSLAVVGGTGLLLAARTWDALSGGVLVALVAKVAIVGLVAVPLGWWHHRTRAGWVGVPRSLRVEAAGLVVALVLGGVLVGFDPGWSSGGSIDPAVAAILDGTVTDPSACRELDVGRAACYRSTLDALLIADGPQTAIDAMVDALARDAYVADNCHQVAHDLGNDAAEEIDDMSVALAVDGSACWSGYFHGFIEARLAGVADADLATQLPTFCDGAADPAYSFTHYNCLHGLGHGLMLRADADLFQALPLCRPLTDWWAVRSCASGAFMENVMAAQQGQDVPGVATDDLLYPCNSVDADLAEDCYLMQTSTILWRLDGDIGGSFAWCDQAPEANQATCYRSMGRDISSIAALDAQGVIDRCSLGRAELAVWCIDGAASNAVYEQSGRAAADALCDAVPPAWLDACTASRDLALETVALG